MLASELKLAVSPQHFQRLHYWLLPYPVQVSPHLALDVLQLLFRWVGFLKVRLRSVDLNQEFIELCFESVFSFLIHIVGSVSPLLGNRRVRQFWQDEHFAGNG